MRTFLHPAQKRPRFFALNGKKQEGITFFHGSDSISAPRKPMGLRGLSVYMIPDFSLLAAMAAFSFRAG